MPSIEHNEDGPSLRPSASMLMDSDEIYSQNGLDETDDFGPPSFRASQSMLAPDGEDSSLEQSPTSAEAENDEDTTSFVSVNRSGNRRSQPATKAELQAAFEADCNARNYNNSDDR